MCLMISVIILSAMSFQTSFAKMMIIEDAGDDFEGSELSGWSFVNDTLKNYTLENGFLKLNTDVSGENSSENMLYLNDTMPEKSEYVIRLKPSGSAEGQLAGVFVWQDWNNKRIFSATGKGSDYIVAVCEGLNNTYPQLITDSDGFVYFKVSRNASEYTFSYSSDGEIFTVLGSQTLDFQTPKIGLVAQHRDDENDFTAEFDYVKVYEDVIEPTIYDEFDGESLSGWKFVNEEHNNYNVSGGSLNINSYVEGADSSENMAYLANPIEGDFEAVIKFKPNAIKANNQSAGIFVWCDWNRKYIFQVVGKGDNYMIVDHTSNTDGWPQIIPDANGSVYFKVVRSGDTYTFSYSSDGVVYTDKVVTQLDFDKVHLGLFAQYGVYGDEYPTSPDDENNFEANFEYIRIYQDTEPTRFYIGDQEVKSLVPGENEIRAEIPYYDMVGRDLCAFAAFYNDGKLVSVTSKEISEISQDGVCEIKLQVDVPDEGNCVLKTFLLDSQNFAPVKQVQSLIK